MKQSAKANILKEIEAINKKEGKGTIFTLDKEGEKGLQVPRVSTGIEQLDHVLGGGLPMGRQIEVSGAPSAGKTTLAHYFTSLFDQAMNHPVEGTFSWDRAKLFGNEEGQLFVHQTSTGESYMNKIYKFAKLGIPIQVVDSVPWLKAKAEIEKRDKAARNNTVENERMSQTTKVINPYIEAIGTACEQTGCTIIWVNQVREKMNAMPFGDNLYTPGGKMLHHSFSIELRLARREWIKIDNYDPRNSATKEIVGLVIKVKCTKNKLSPPERECELVYFYDRGFVAHSERKEIEAELKYKRKEFFKNKSNWKEEAEEIPDNWDETDDWDEDEDWD